MNKDERDITLDNIKIFIAIRSMQGIPFNSLSLEDLIEYIEKVHGKIL